MSEKPLFTNPNTDGPQKGPILGRQHLQIDNENYLLTEHCVPFCMEWLSLYEAQDIKIDTKEQLPFGVILKLKYPEFADPQDDLNRATAYFGIQESFKEYNEKIEMGLYLGRLYFNKIFDIVNLPKAKLVEGINIVLVVKPQADENCISTLYALDAEGTELSKIKTNKLLTADWSGGVSIGAHFKSIRIEGFKLNY
jgi:hypothetical protein